MRGAHKSRVVIGGMRMIDIVVGRLVGQASTILISGPDDYGTGLTAVPDAPGAPPGPAGGIWSVRRHLAEVLPDLGGFVTVPVDAPFLPSDLVERLSRLDRSAIGADLLGEHPAFGFWRMGDLDDAFARVGRGSELPLRHLALLCDARLEVFSDTRSLYNVNTREDLALAERLVTGGDWGSDVRE